MDMIFSGDSMKTRHLIHLFVLIIVSQAFSQKSRFGFKAGYNLSLNYGNKASAKIYDVDPNFRHAAGAGVFLYFPITKTFGMQYECLYVMKGSRNSIDLKEEPIHVDVAYGLDYLEIPIFFRIQIHRFGKVRLFATSGWALSILLKTDYDLTGTVEFNDAGTIRIIPISASGDMPDTDIFDYSFLFGGGILFPFANRQCVFEYRFTIGWNVLMLPTYENQDPVPLRNQSYLFMLSIPLFRGSRL
jgi:hypothetical protein